MFPYLILREPPKLQSDILAPDVTVGVAAQIQTNQTKAFMQIKSDGIGICRLGLQNQRPAAGKPRLLFSNLHQRVPIALLLQRRVHPKLGDTQSVRPLLCTQLDGAQQLAVFDDSSGACALPMRSKQPIGKIVPLRRAGDWLLQRLFLDRQ